MASRGGYRDQQAKSPKEHEELKGLLKFCVKAAESERATNQHISSSASDEKGSTRSSNDTQSESSPQNEDNVNSLEEGSKHSEMQESFWSAMEQGRVDQDKALKPLGLYRYKIPGDGNCMFRAVASQLDMKQSYHVRLRHKAVDWMKDNKDQLLAGGLLDNMDEIKQTSKIGMWPGQAALVAMANVLNVNIAIIHGGDKGNIDIQHVSPDKPPEEKDTGIILAYLYNGHYDAVVQEPDAPNAAYKEWLIEVEDKAREGETLARNIDRYGSAFLRNRTSGKESEITTESPCVWDKKDKKTEPNNSLMRSKAIRKNVDDTYHEQFRVYDNHTDIKDITGRMMALESDPVEEYREYKDYRSPPHCAVVTQNNPIISVPQHEYATHMPTPTTSYYGVKPRTTTRTIPIQRPDKQLHADDDYRDSNYPWDRRLHSNTTTYRATTDPIVPKTRYTESYNSHHDSRSNFSRPTRVTSDVTIHEEERFHHGYSSHKPRYSSSNIYVVSRNIPSLGERQNLDFIRNYSPLSRTDKTRRHKYVLPNY